MRPLWPVLALMSTGCAATYRNVTKLETDWLGRVKSVEGGTQSPAMGWLDGLSNLLGSLSWLAVAGGAVFLILLWKAPGLFRRIRDQRAARAALSRRSQP